MLKGKILNCFGARILTTFFCVASLTLAALAQNPGPSAAETKKADPTAWNLLKSARDAGQRFPDNLSGVTVDVVFNDHGKRATGKADYKTGERAQVQIEGVDDDAKLWLEEQVNSIITHRRGGDFSKGDGKYPITFGEDDNSPAGRRLILNDSMKSSYRIRNNQVSEVDRTIGGEHFTISIIETVPVPGGKFLPRHFTVTYFDAKSGAIKRTESFSDEYTKVGNIWFPASRRMVRAENGRVITRLIEFRNPKLTFSNEQAAR